MRKQYTWFRFWIVATVLAAVRFIEHLQANKSGWRLLFDVMLLVVFTANCIEKWNKIKAAKGKDGRT